MLLHAPRLGDGAVELVGLVVYTSPHKSPRRSKETAAMSALVRPYKRGGSAANIAFRVVSLQCVLKIFGAR